MSLLRFKPMQPKHTQHDLLSVGESAAMVGISRDTLKRWEAAGRVTSLRTPTGHRRFRRADIEALLTDEAAS